MWNPEWSSDPEAWTTWAYLHGGPSTMREFEARRRGRRDFDFDRGRDCSWDVEQPGQWTMGDPGNWAVPGPYAGPGSFPNPGFGGFNRHLGHVGPPVESPMDYEWGSTARVSRRGAHYGRGPKGYRRSDARILEDVCDALMEDGDVDAAEIEVAVENGEVSLTGTVGDRRQKRLAEDVCDGVAGVTDVHNGLHVATAAGKSAPRRAKTG